VKDCRYAADHNKIDFGIVEMLQEFVKLHHSWPRALLA
jgi:hypothetical protein